MKMRGKMHKRTLLQNSPACQWSSLPTRDEGQDVSTDVTMFISLTYVLNLLLACYAETLTMETIGRDRGPSEKLVLCEQHI